MVGTFTKFSRNRSSHRPKHHHFLEERVGGNRISPAAALHGVPPLETFEAVEHPSEPVDVNQPARCPPPERSIMQDGLRWKETLAEVLRRQNERRNVTLGAPPRRRIPSSPREKYLFVTQGAPGRVVMPMQE